MDLMIKEKVGNISKKQFNLLKAEFDLLIFGIKKPSNFNLKIKWKYLF